MAELAPLAAALLLAGGCESFQRKFVRKPKHERERFTPVIAFQDYTRTMTPIDRYRKHYLMFDYWNGDLIAALQDAHPNPKRIRRASGEALLELETLQQLLGESKAAALAPLVEERRRLDRDVQRPGLDAGRAGLVVRELEAQERALRRDFFWREAEAHLKSEPALP